MNGWLRTEWIWMLSCMIVFSLPIVAMAQSSKLPNRAKPPVFEAQKFEGVFFPDVNSALNGQLPKTQSTLQINSSAVAGSSASNAGVDPMGWKDLIAAETLEDLVKTSKLRLDKIVTTPAAFAGGGNLNARREFSLLTLLFAIVETYPGEVRWKASAPAARDALQRAAQNMAYDESKKRLQDLQSLLNGSAWNVETKQAIDWGNLIDIAPLMRVAEWAHDEQIAKLTSSEASFKKNQEEIGKLAELVAVLGKACTFETMPNADDAQFVSLAKEMIDHAKQVRLAVETGDAELARTAASKLSLSCTNCHNSYKL